LVGEWDCQRIPAQRDLSVSEIKRSYDLGLLTRPAVESRLNRLGWVNGAAESITTLWDIDATEARQKALQAVQKQADNQLTEQLKIDTHNIVKEGAEIEKDFARVEKDIQTGLSIAQKAASAEQKGIEGEVSDAFKIDVKNAVAEGTAIEKDAAALDKQVAGAKKKKTTTSKKKPATGA